MKSPKPSRGSEWAAWYAGEGFPVFPCKARRKDPLTANGFKDAATDLHRIREWWRLWPDANIGLATGGPSGLIALDIDPRNGGDESWAALRGGRKIPKTAKQWTGGGGKHIIFRDPGGIRCGALAPGLDVKGDGGYVIVPPSVHPSGEHYRWTEGRGAALLLDPATVPDWLLSELRSMGHRRTSLAAADRDVWSEGERNNNLTSLAGTMRQRGMSRKAIEAGLLAENAERCKPPLTDEEVFNIATSVSRYEPGNLPAVRENGQRRYRMQPNWPSPLGPDAFRGVAGEFVQLTAPHTEADPAALLLQTLVAAGNFVGRNAHFRAEADLHYTNLFTVIVGLTSKGRKGTSLGHIKRIMSEVDAHWVQARMMGGLSTGEGLIAELQDEGGEKQKDGQNKQRKSKSGPANGIPLDKRLMVVEPELARVLQVVERPANIISAVLRQSWDDGTLRIMTKKDPARATNAHVSLIAHITKPELRRCMKDTSIANGFANRILWTCARRSQPLPEGGEIDKVNFTGVVQQLRAAAKFASTARELRRDVKASAQWKEVYEQLSEGKPGLLGAATSRAEAQVMRIACVYAVLDCSNLIRVQHLRAALEVWRYCEDSARFIFGESLGDPTADEILRAVQLCRDGMTRDEIREHFSHNKPSAEIDRALSVLQEYGLARLSKEKSGGRGRPSERWHATTGLREKSGKSV